MKFTAVLMFTYALAAPLPALNLGGVFKGASAQASRLTTALKPKTTFAKVGAGVVLGGAAVGGGVLLVNQLGKGPAVEAPDPNDPANAVDAQAAAGQGDTQVTSGDAQATSESQAVAAQINAGSRDPLATTSQNSQITTDQAAGQTNTVVQSDGQTGVDQTVGQTAADQTAVEATGQKFVQDPANQSNVQVGTPVALDPSTQATAGTQPLESNSQTQVQDPAAQPQQAQEAPSTIAGPGANFASLIGPS